MREGWEQIRLGDVCNINKRNIRKDFGFSEITYLDISSVGSGIADFSNILPISEAPSRAKRLPSKSDTIIATVRPGNRTFSYLREFPENTVVSTGFAVISPMQDLIDSRFLYYLISEPSFTGYLVSIEQGANYPAVSAKDISDAKIILPPLPTQRKIAAILSAYDDLIENNLKRIKLLEEKAQLTYEEWFVRMKFPGHETAVIDAETGLPEGWEKLQLKEIANFKYGKMPKKDKVVQSGYSIYSGYRVTGNYSEVMFEEPTLIVVARGVGGTGDVKLTPPKCWLTNLSIAVLTNENTTQNYLFYLLKDSNLRSLDSGAAQSQITINSLENIRIDHASIILQRQFDGIIKIIFDEIRNLKGQNELLKEARDILLPRLMTGMIDVEKIEVDTLTPNLS